MKKYMTKFAALSMAALMAVSMTACSLNQGPEDDTEITTVANPVTEMSEEEMCEKTGIDLPLPAEATDAVYSVVESEDGDIAQVSFKLDGKDMYLRACFTSITSLGTDMGEGSIEEIQNFDTDKGNISGLYYEWNLGGANDVQNREAIVNVSKAGAGYIAWLDVVPGILYNLCMEKDADMDLLVNTANDIFVPMQGEAEADEGYVAIQADFDNLIDTIYETKAGSAGSSDRVVAAATQLIDFVNNYADSISAQNIEALASGKLADMKAQNEGFEGNFTECMDAVKEEALNQNPDLETDVAFGQVVNGIENALVGLE